MDAGLNSLMAQPMWVVLCLLARLAPVLAWTPPTHGTVVPKRLRAGLAVVLAILLVPQALLTAPHLPDDLLHQLLALAGELLLGTLLATVVLLCISSLQVAGQLIGHLAGWDMASSGFSPLGSASPAAEQGLITQLLGWLAILLILAVGGHRFFLQACLESVSSYPLGTVQFQTEWLQELQLVLSHTYEVGIRAAAPIMMTLVTVNLACGLLARAMPQINFLSVGFGLNSLALLVGLLLSMGSVSWVFQQQLAGWLNSLARLVTLDF